MQTFAAHAGWNGPPQGAQMLPEQTSVALLQVPAAPPQHGCPWPPQPAHWPVARQTSPRLQVAGLVGLVTGTQVFVPATSQQPLVHCEPGQQGWPIAALPHGEQSWVWVLHTVPGALHTSPAQQGSPPAGFDPHDTQKLPWQRVLAPRHTPFPPGPGQHSVETLPQARQVFMAWQEVAVAVQT